MQTENMKKKIGLLTMHRVVNFGSILQAYATQVVIEKLGYDCEIINYQYPNKIHSMDYTSPLLNVVQFLMEIRFGFPERKKRRKFRLFREKYLHQSEYFKTRDDLLERIPEYDTYIVGSDQTWNIRHIGFDDIFLLSFVPADKRRISYASSAARKELPSLYVDFFKQYLSVFNAISVRERHTQELIKSLLGKDVSITLDPTLLLDANEWQLLAKKSKLKVKTPFILVYILKYSFLPYPTATKVIKDVYDKYHLPIVALRYSARENMGIEDVIDLHESVGPEDFLWLFMNASFVITTSFHGTAFSLNFRKPFYAIYNSSIEDDRIYSLLHLLGAESCGIDVCKDYQNVETIDYDKVSEVLNSERNKSILFLRNNLK